MLSAPAFGQSYSAFDIGSLGGGGTYAAAINASGQVTGNSITEDGPYHAFVTKANGLGINDLGTFQGGFNSYGFGINASGQVAGVSEYTSNPLLPTSPYAFITDAKGDLKFATSWSYSEGHAINNLGQVAGYSRIANTDGGVFVTAANGLNARHIGNLHSYNDQAFDINTSGQVVGASEVSTGITHAFIASANHVYASDLGTLGGYNSSATGVNDSGKVVGWSALAQDPYSLGHAFITDINSNMTDLGTLGGHLSAATDINSSGHVIGWSETGIANRRHAFITGPDGIAMTDLNSLVKLENGTFLAGATGINDRGQIIANGSDGHSYLLTPVPEPEAYALFLAGLGLMGFMVRRRKTG